jgi:L-lactate dehydrogenase complex protein LldE
MAESAPTVALFVTCLVDLFRPTVAEATALLLRQAGYRVVVPVQTCCGQANFNGGDRAGAAILARRMIEAFRSFQYVVAPSGSCVGMIRDYPALFPASSVDHADAQALASRTWELTAFLREVAAVALKSVRWQATAAYHDSCSGLRQLGVREQPRELLRHVEGLEIREVGNPEECCGFGGSFCVKYSAVAVHIGDRKIDDIAATGASHVIGGDLGCLLHLEGRMQRRGIEVRAVHVAEALAGLIPGVVHGDH